MPRQVLLVEPNYKNKYPPMGLMKLSTYHKRLGDNVRFFKGDMRELALSLVFDDLITVLRGINPEILWENHTPQLMKYIRSGKTADFPSGFYFDNGFVIDAVRLYRHKFKTKDYFNTPKFDVVAITTLFTFHWDITIETINFVKKLCRNQNKVFVGGIMASILPEDIERETGIRPYVGVLDKPGIYDEDSDINIDTIPLDYSILDEIEYKYPTRDAYFGYMTRGCPNKCSFCLVPTLEPVFIEYVPIKEQIEEINESFGEQKDLILLDNNVLFSDCFDRIIDEIKECGFYKGSDYLPPNQYEIAINNLRAGINDRAYVKRCVELYKTLLDKCRNLNICRNVEVYYELYERITEMNCYHEYTATPEAILALDEFIAPLYKKYAYKPHKRQRYIDFNQGIDARLIAKYPERLNRLPEINIRPLRIAFDNWKIKDIYEKAVRIAADVGIKDLSNYLLYNSDESDDTPLSLFYRMQMNIDLCEELGIAIYSFPMKYHPVDDPRYFRNRDFIGKAWNRKYVRAVQAVLNSTKGKIGRGKSFFEAAFGKNEDEFNQIMVMPEAFIIQRYKYKDNLTAEWWAKYISLDKSQRERALEIILENQFSEEIISSMRSPAVRDVLNYYLTKRDDR